MSIGWILSGSDAFDGLRLEMAALTSLVMLLLLSYNSCLRMISEALELRVEGERVSHSWYMYVVCHGFGGLGGAGMECMRDKARGLGCMLGDAGALHSAR